MRGGERQRVLALLVASACCGLAGTGALVLAARRLGAWVWGAGATSVGLGWPLLAGAVAEAAAVWAGGAAGVELSTVLRRRSLEHVLDADPDGLASFGTGAAMAFAADAELVGSFLTTTAPAVVLGSIETIVGAVLLAGTVNGGPRLLVVAGTASAGLVVHRHLARRRRAWSAARAALTGRFVERLIGQRTVALQERSAGLAKQGRLSGDAQRRRAATDAYERVSTRLDLANVLIDVVVYAGIGALLLLVVHLAGRGAPAPAVAAALGSSLLVESGLLRWRSVSREIAGAAVAAEGVRALGRLRRAEVTPAASPVGDEVVGLRVSGTGRGSDAIRPIEDVDLSVGPTDRLVLSGASGSGKTTLMELLQGRRALPESAVRRRAGATVVRVPQAGDDHLFRASLLYNVVAPRAWPPDADAESDARAVLDELGLGELVERMPAGILQPIGNGGWRLSSGEAARVRLARALVQRPDVLVLDETLSPLDAIARRRALAACERWAGAIVVVAHR